MRPSVSRPATASASAAEGAGSSVTNSSPPIRNTRQPRRHCGPRLGELVQDVRTQRQERPHREQHALEPVRAEPVSRQQPDRAERVGVRQREMEREHRSVEADQLVAKDDLAKEQAMSVVGEQQRPE